MRSDLPWRKTENLLEYGVRTGFVVTMGTARFMHCSLSVLKSKKGTL
jgi:hypothetical protein